MGCGPSAPEAPDPPHSTGNDPLFGKISEARSRSDPVAANLSTCHPEVLRDFFTSLKYGPLRDSVADGDLKLMSEVVFNSERCSSGPLVRFPTQPQIPGVGKWKPQDPRKLRKVLYSHNLYHGGEQILFLSKVQMADRHWKLGERVVVVTALGRILVIKQGPTRTFVESHTHVGFIQRICETAYDDKKLSLVDNKIEVHLTNGCWYLLGGAMPVIRNLVQAVHAILTVAQMLPERLSLVVQLNNDFISRMPLPALPQDGGLYDAYTIWHNYHSTQLSRVETPMPMKVQDCICPSKRYRGKYALLEIRKGLLDLSLDITGWDSIAIAAVAQALGTNSVFKSLMRKDEDRCSVYLAPILQHNTTLLKLDLGGDKLDGRALDENALRSMGEALTKNPGSSLADLNLSGLPIRTDEARLWSEGLRKLKPMSLVVLNISHCSISVEGMALLLDSISSQGKSLQHLNISHNSLEREGTKALVKVLQKPGLRYLGLAGCSMDWDLLEHSLESLLAFKKLTSIDLSHNTYHSCFHKLIKACGDSLQFIQLQGCTDLSWASFLKFINKKDISVDLGKNNVLLQSDRINFGLMPRKHIGFSSCGLGFSLLENLFGDIIKAQKTGVQDSPPKSIDVSDNTNFLINPIYTFMLHEWARPDFTSAIEEAMAAENIEDGLKWFKKSIEYASKQAAIDGYSNPYIYAAFEASKKIAHFMHIPGIECLNLAGGTAKDSAFGPLLAVPLSLGLPFQCSLTYLDVSQNSFGDAGCIALAKALRKNRTLTALRFDDNHVQLEGLKAIKGCLIGNQKLVDMPFPHNDMDACLRLQGKLYQSSLERELDARRQIARGWTGGRPNHYLINPAMDILKQAKGDQSRARMEKNKLRQTAADIQAFLARNKEIHKVKKSAKIAKDQLKDQAKARKEAAKSESRAKKLQNKIWQTRHKLMERWIRAVKKSGRHPRWWKTWLNEWGRAYMTTAALDRLWKSVPAAEKAKYQSTYEFSVDAFEDEAQLVHEAHKLNIDIDEAKASCDYLQREVEYNQSLADVSIPIVVKNARSHLRQFRADPKIVIAPDPGKVTDAEIGLSRYSANYWQRRRSILYSRLQSHIRNPPKDYRWNRLETVQTPSWSMEPPTLVYSAPEVEMTVQRLGQAQDQEFPQPSGSSLQPAEECPVSPPPVAPAGSTQDAPQPMALDLLCNPSLRGARGYHAWSDYVKEHQRQAEKPGKHYNHRLQHTYKAVLTRMKEKKYKPHSFWKMKKKQKKQTATNHSHDHGYDQDYRQGYDQGYDQGYGQGYSHGTHIYPPDYYYLLYGYYYGGYYNSNSDSSSVSSLGSNEAQSPSGSELDIDLPEDFDDSRFQDLVEASVQESTDYDEAEEVAENVDVGDVDVEVDDLDGEADEMDMYGSAGPRDLPEGPEDGRKHRPLTCMSTAMHSDDYWWPWKAQDTFSRFEHGGNGDVVRWVDQTWLSLLKEAEKKTIGEATVIDFDKDPCVFKSGLNMRGSVTLITQASMDRMDRLEAQARAWKGKISVAIYIPDHKGHLRNESKLAEIKQLHEAFEKDGICEMNISLLYSNHSQDEPMPCQQMEKYDRLYPINALRNLALQQATTDLVFLLDIDFVPSNQLMAALEGHCNDDSRAAIDEVRESGKRGEGVMLVVPAFEAPTHQVLPKTKMQALQMLQEKKISPFHIGHFPQGHVPTNYEAWMRAFSPYEIHFREYYEPYVLASRHVVKPYDERFRGYGLNKISHIYAAAASGFTFKVLPDHFVVAHEHKQSSSHAQVFGSGGDPYHRVQIASIYRKLKYEIQCSVGTYIEKDMSGEHRATKLKTPRTCTSAGLQALGVIKC